MDDKTKDRSLDRNEEIGRKSPVIDIHKLRYSWSKNLPLVLDIENFRVNRGERVFILGPSGSGKSTLLGILTGILSPQHGEVNILQHQLSTLHGAVRDRFRADHIGYIYQMFNLIPYLSLIENVTLPCQFSAMRKKRAVSKGGDLKKEALRLLEHLNLQGARFLDKPVVELSVGQQQRVAAARALIGSPDLVIADEPTSSLDSEHREGFLRLLFDECQSSGATLIFVSHDVSLIPLFDRVVELQRINNVAQN